MNLVTQLTSVVEIGVKDLKVTPIQRTDKSKVGATIKDNGQVIGVIPLGDARSSVVLSTTNTRATGSPSTLHHLRMRTRRSITSTLIRETTGWYWYHERRHYPHPGRLVINGSRPFILL